MKTGSPRHWLIAILFSLQSMVAGATDIDPSDGVITIYPVTTGVAHTPGRPISQVVVLSARTGPSINAALAAAHDIFRRGGVTVIDYAASSRPSEPHGPDLREHSTTDSGFLAWGKRLGADHVVVVDITDTLVLERRGSRYLHDEQVSVRGLSVHTGTVVLEGMARWSQPVEQAGDHIRELTAYAIGRAICTPEKWVEASAANHGRGRCQP
jgi:hypothetical protein